MIWALGIPIKSAKRASLSGHRSKDGLVNKEHDGGITSETWPFEYDQDRVTSMYQGVPSQLSVDIQETSITSAS